MSEKGCGGGSEEGVSVSMVIIGAPGSGGATPVTEEAGLHIKMEPRMLHWEPSLAALLINAPSPW